MMDIALLSQMNSTQHLRPVVPTSVPEVTAIASTSKSSAHDARADSQNSGNGAATSHAFAQQKAKTPIQTDTIPGPPPTFQVSVLEMEAYLTETLARQNATQAFSDPKLGQTEMPDPTDKAQGQEAAIAPVVVETADAARPDAMPMAATNPTGVDA